MQPQDITPEIKELMEHYQNEIKNCNDSQEYYRDFALPYLKKMIGFIDKKNDFTWKLENLKEKVGCQDCLCDEE